jgi:hypothetical protein
MRFPLLALALLLLPAQEKSASGALGMAAAEHRDGAAAAVLVLERGGNAVDAAVAAAFAMGVALPSHSGLGGRSQLLVVLKDRAFHIDGGTQVPKSWKEGEGGRSRPCIPSLAALDLAPESGTMSRMAPAIELAKAKSSKTAAELVATLEATPRRAEGALRRSPTIAADTARGGRDGGGPRGVQGGSCGSNSGWRG